MMVCVVIQGGLPSARVHIITSLMVGHVSHLHAFSTEISMTHQPQLINKLYTSLQVVIPGRQARSKERVPDQL